MGDRRNFLDADNSIMEKNLRFVQSDLEQNLNQFFSSGPATSGGRGNYDESPSVSAPPRDYKVVQPSPGNRFGNVSSNPSGYNVKQNYTSSSNNYYNNSGQHLSGRPDNSQQQQFSGRPDNSQQQQFSGRPDNSQQQCFARRPDNSQQQFGDDNNYSRNRNANTTYRNDVLFKSSDELAWNNENFGRNNDRLENNSGFRNNEQFGGNFGSGNQSQFANNNEAGWNRPYSSNNEEDAFAFQSGNYRDSSDFRNNSQQFGGKFDSGNLSQFGNNNGSGWKRPHISNNEHHAASFNKKPRLGNSKPNLSSAPTAPKNVAKNKNASTTDEANSDGKNRKKKRPDDNQRARNKNANVRKQELKALQASGALKKPAKGKIKGEPEKYWREWWTKHAYIEKAIEKIDENDEAVRTFIKFTYEPSEKKFNERKKLLLKIGVGKINRNMDIDEVNHGFRDVYKLFVYKKHLEDPNFQKHLNNQEKNVVGTTVKRLENKAKMALLHQSLISRWHHSKKVIGEQGNTKNANKLLNDKLFHYLVLDSIHELKKLSSQDWPEFEEFYDSL